VTFRGSILRAANQVSLRFLKRPTAPFGVHKPEVTLTAAGGLYLFTLKSRRETATDWSEPVEVRRALTVTNIWLLCSTPDNGNVIVKILMVRRVVADSKFTPNWSRRNAARRESCKLYLSP